MWQEQRKGQGPQGGEGGRGLRELLTLCQLPFVLNAEAKARIMQGEALLIKQHQVQSSAIQVHKHPAFLTFCGHLFCCRAHRAQLTSASLQIRFCC